MLSFRACQTVLLTAMLAVVPAFASHTHRAPTSGHSKSAKKKAAAHKLHGPRQMDADRAREIQTALIREKYLSGEPTGQWDQESQSAMQKYQADNGWQTKITPDSRALIKLGLGPNHEAGPTTASAQPSEAPAESPSITPAALPTKKGNTLAEAHSIAN
jgi:hypothetical protein